MESVMEFSLGDVIAVLTRTPTAVNALLRGLPTILVRSNEGKDTWSAFDIVGHLISLERTQWLQRVRIVLEAWSTSSTISPACEGITWLRFKHLNYRMRT
jgi:hypothetical protein